MAGLFSIVNAKPFNTSNDGLNILYEDSGKLLLALNAPYPGIDQIELDGRQYHILNRIEAVRLVEPGKPELPFHSVMVAVPCGSEISYKVITKTTVLINNIIPLPAPKIIPTTHHSDKASNKKFHYKRKEDKAVYENGSLYPNRIVKFAGRNTFRGIDLVNIRLHSFQYNSREQQILYHPSITVEISWDVETSNPGRKRFSDDSPLRALVGKLTINSLPHYTPVESAEQSHDYYSSSSFSLAPVSGIKIITQGEGITKITGALLESAGISISSLDPENLYLKNQENIIPIEFTGGSDAVFDRDDYFLFFAESMNTRYTDKNVYWLLEGSVPGLRISEKPVVTSPVVPVEYLHYHHATDNKTYMHEMEDVGYVDDHWFVNAPMWAPIVRPFSINIDNVSGSAGSGLFRVMLQGISFTPDMNSHHSKIYLNGNLVDDTYWGASGDKYLYEGVVPHSYFVEGKNDVIVELPGDSGSPYELVFLDWIEAEYWRRFISADGYTLKFAYGAHGSVSLESTGFKEETPVIFDITDPETPEKISDMTVIPDGPDFKISFGQFLIQTRTFYIATESGLLSPVEIVQDTPSNLKDTSNSADYIIITDPEFITQAGTLASAKISSGLRTIIVDINDIYDEFSEGIFDPTAIKSFLEYTYSNWTAPVPSFVALLGDDNYDYRNFHGFGELQWIPSTFIHSLEMGETCGDNSFVCMDGPDDYLPDMIIGRIPARNAAQATDIINKILSYESLPMGQTWMKNSAAVADNEETYFEYMCTDFESYLPSDYVNTELFLSGYSTPGDCLNDIKNTFNDGALMIVYAGHGSVQGWASEQIFTNDSITELDPSTKLPLVLMLSCLNGYFSYPDTFECIAEELFRRSDAGSCSTIAATGVSFPSVQKYFARGIYESLFTNRNENLGLAFLNGKLNTFAELGIDGKNVIKTFSLFGDPALIMPVEPLPTSTPTVTPIFSNTPTSTLTPTITPTPTFFTPALTATPTSTPFLVRTERATVVPVEPPDLPENTVTATDNPQSIPVTSNSTVFLMLSILGAVLLFKSKYLG